MMNRLQPGIVSSLFVVAGRVFVDLAGGYLTAPAVIPLMK
jgi:hypothetical protein